MNVIVLCSDDMRVGSVVWQFVQVDNAMDDSSMLRAGEKNRIQDGQPTHAKRTTLYKEKIVVDMVRATLSFSSC
jgi:hypothetical protein